MKFDIGLLSENHVQTPTLLREAVPGIEDLTSYNYHSRVKDMN